MTTETNPLTPVGEATLRRYLALGDSYTIGEAVAVEQSFPAQLAARLREQGIALDEPLIIARTGWTTDELDAAIAQSKPCGPYDLVTLLIGVNNQYRGRSAEAYRPEFVRLLQQAVAFAGGEPRRVIVVSIPDWGVTPFGRGRTGVDAEIDAFNRVNREQAERAGVWYVDITPASRMARTAPELTAEDGLHPSGAMYAQWVELILPAARQIVE